ERGIGVAAGRAAEEIWNEADRIMDASGGLASRMPLETEQWTGFPAPDEAEEAIDWEPEVPW
ncbi:MAG TPA: hypothetical protein VE964_12785, partial [Myxococcales bacterium]|nr:hypothetical protein [Myxococcales bacterium]